MGGGRGLIELLKARAHDCIDFERSKLYAIVKSPSDVCLYKTLNL